MKLVRIKETGEVFKLHRVDKHVYPVCANYTRYRLEDVEIL